MLSVTMAGLNAAQKSMDVTSNNMANSNTVGFKRSTAVFGDVFSSDPASNPKTAVGSGVMTSSVSRDTTAGAVKTTGKVTDLAIDGRGYFVVRDPSPGAPMTFTRAGNFGLDANGFIVDASGNQLMGFNAQQLLANNKPVLDANGNTVMAPNLNQSQALQVSPQYAAGLPLPDGSIANQEIQQINFSGPSVNNTTIVVAGVPIELKAGQSPQQMQQTVYDALTPAINSGDLTSVTKTGSNDASGIRIGFPYIKGPVSSQVQQSNILSLTAMTTQLHADATPATASLPVTGSLVANDTYTFSIPTTSNDTPTLEGVSVTVPTDPTKFVDSLNSAIQDAAKSASLTNTQYPVATLDANSRIVLTWSSDPASTDGVTPSVTVNSGDNNSTGAATITGIDVSMVSPEKGLAQTIDFRGPNAPADMTLSIAGVTLDITKDMSSVQIANMVQAALTTQYPPSSGTTITQDTQGKLAIQFDPANAGAKPLKPSYANKPTQAMISELSKYSTDPVLMQGISIDPKGQVAATYSNGSTYTMGFLELANFANDGGLKDIGGNRFVQTGASGQPVITAAGAPKAGNIMSGALEQANVDITSELMDMIRAQQVYNGNARVLQTTVDTVTKITDMR